MAESKLVCLRECSVCMENYDELVDDKIPLILPCSHTFCRHCCSGLAMQNGDGVIGIKCPVCRKFNPGKSQSFLQNPYILAFLDEHNSPAKCETPDCRKKCEGHFFCEEESCRSPVCRECVESEHKDKDHKVVWYADFVQTRREAINDTLSEVKKNVEQSIQKAGAEIKKSMEELNEQRKMLHIVLDEKQKGGQQKKGDRAEKLKNLQHASVDLQVDALKKIMAKQLQELKEEDFLQTTKIEQKVAKCSSTNGLEQLQKSVENIGRFQIGVQLMGTASIVSLGEVHVVLDLPTTTLLIGPKGSSARIHAESINSTRDYIEFLAVSGGRAVLYHTEGNASLVQREEGERSLRLQIVDDDVNGFICIKLGDEDNIVLSQGDRLLVFPVGDRTPKDSIPVGKIPVCIAPGEAGVIYFVACGQQDLLPKSIQSFNVLDKGEPTTVFFLPDIKCVEDLSCKFFRGKLFFLVAMAESGARCFSTTGNQLWAFEDRADGICSDTSGRVYIANNEKGVVILDLETGRQVGLFQAGKVTRPLKVRFCDEDGHLVVVGHGTEVASKLIVAFVEIR